MKQRYFFLPCLIISWAIFGYMPSTFSADIDYLAELEHKAKEILQKSVQALGGEAYLKLGGTVRSGKIFQLRDDTLRGFTKVQFFDKFPAQSRSELGKQEIVTINNGDKGWKIEYKNVKEQTPEELEDFKINLKHNLDYILRFRLKEEGMKFRYLGKSRIELDEVEGVQLLDRTGDKVKIYVNASTFLPAKIEFQTPGHGKKWTTDDERFYFNYHPVEGVQIPYSTIRYSNGYKISEVVLESVAVNQDFKDSLFQPVSRK
jgi:hypothetical protein